MDFNVKEPYEKLGGDNGDEFVRQNGIIYGWSESNYRYEIAWWFYTRLDSPLIRNLRETRPLPFEGELPLPIPENYQHDRLQD